MARHHLPTSRAPFAVASRTDRGVSAVGNALVVGSDLSGPALLRSLNGLSPAVFFTRATVVEETFRVRRAIRRTYRYFEPSDPARPELWEAAARLFAGTVDVRSFGRGVPADRPQWRTVESVTIHPEKSGLVVEVRAPFFVWGMVRKILGALREIGAERLDLAQLSEALRGRRRLTLPMAEPEPLVLWDIEYPIVWQHVWNGPNRHQARWWALAGAEARVRQRVLHAIERGTAFSEYVGAERVSQLAPSARASAPR
jgi:tRNA pseudouridine38-40 synthase